MLGGMPDEPKEENDATTGPEVQEELIPAPPIDAARKERLAAILRGEKPGKGRGKGVSEKRKSNVQREKAERESMKKSLRGPRKRG
jgi:hypothetical protein